MRISSHEPSLFESKEQEQLLSDLGNPLLCLDKHINWEEFRLEISNIFPKQNKRLGGRPRKDVVLMFKILILQQLYNMSDRNTEYQIADRSSFRSFLKIKSTREVPDEKTIWIFEFS